MRLLKIEKVLLIVTGILFFFTFTCGLWLQFSGEEIIFGDVLFHLSLAIITTVSTAASIIFLIKNK